MTPHGQPRTDARQDACVSTPDLSSVGLVARLEALNKTREADGENTLVLN